MDYQWHWAAQAELKNRSNQRVGDGSFQTMYSVISLEVPVPDTSPLELPLIRPADATDLADALTSTGPCLMLIAE